MVDHENLVTISCFRTFLIFIQSYIFNFCIYFKCFLLYLYMHVCGQKKYLNRTLAIDSPFQTFMRYRLLVEFID